MNEQSVKSSPDRLRCDRPRIHGIGSKGSFATTRPSKLIERTKEETQASRLLPFAKHLHRIEHAEQGHEGKTRGKHGFHLNLDNERTISASFGMLLPWRDPDCSLSISPLAFSNPTEHSRNLRRRRAVGTPIGPRLLRSSMNCCCCCCSYSKNRSGCDQ